MKQKMSSPSFSQTATATGATVSAVSPTSDATSSSPDRPSRRRRRLFGKTLLIAAALTLTAGGSSNLAPSNLADLSLAPSAHAYAPTLVPGYNEALLHFEWPPKNTLGEPDATDPTLRDGSVRRTPTRVGFGTYIVIGADGISDNYARVMEGVITSPVTIWGGGDPWQLYAEDDNYEALQQWRVDSSVGSIYVLNEGTYFDQITNVEHSFAGGALYVGDGRTATNNLYIAGHGSHSGEGTDTIYYGALQLSQRATYTGTITVLEDATIAAVGGATNIAIGIISGKLINPPNLPIDHATGQVIGAPTLTFGIHKTGTTISNPAGGSPIKIPGYEGPEHVTGTPDVYSTIILTGDNSGFTGDIVVAERTTLQIGNGSRVASGNLDGGNTVYLYTANDYSFGSTDGTVAGDGKPRTLNVDSAGIYHHPLLINRVADISIAGVIKSGTLATTNDTLQYAEQVFIGKRGRSTLYLTGENTFSGGIDVFEGALAVPINNYPTRPDRWQPDALGVEVAGGYGNQNLVTLYSGTTLKFYIDGTNPPSTNDTLVPVNYTIRVAGDTEATLELPSNSNLRFYLTTLQGESSGSRLIKTGAGTLVLGTNIPQNATSEQLAQALIANPSIQPVRDGDNPGAGLVVMADGSIVWLNKASVTAGTIENGVALAEVHAIGAAGLEIGRVVEKTNSATNSYVGDGTATVIISGSGGDQIAAGARVTINNSGTLDLHAHSEGFGYLTGTVAASIRNSTREASATEDSDILNFSTFTIATTSGVEQKIIRAILKAEAIAGLTLEGTGSNQHYTLPDGRVVYVQNEEITGYGVRQVVTSIGKTVTLTIGEGADASERSIYAGTFEDELAPINIVKTGASVLNFTGAAVYRGTTLIEEGTLRIGNGSNSLVFGSATSTSPVEVREKGTLAFCFAENVNIVTTDAGRVVTGYEFSREIKGEGTLQLEAGEADTLKLTGAANYTGRTNVVSGEVWFANENDVPDTSALTLSPAGSRIRVKNAAGITLNSQNLTSYGGHARTIESKYVDGNTGQRLTYDFTGNLTITGGHKFVVGSDLLAEERNVFAVSNKLTLGYTRLSVTLDSAPDALLSVTGNYDAIITNTLALDAPDITIIPSFINGIQNSATGIASLTGARYTVLKWSNNDESIVQLINSLKLGSPLDPSLVKAVDIKVGDDNGDWNSELFAFFGYKTPRGQTTVHLEVDTGNREVNVVVTGPGNHNLTWIPNSGDGTWHVADNTSVPADLRQWSDPLEISAPYKSTFYDYDTATFDGSLSPSIFATITGPVEPARIRVVNSTNAGGEIRLAAGAANVTTNYPAYANMPQYGAEPDGKIIGATGIYKDTTGYLYLSGVNTFTGQVIIKKGILQLEGYNTQPPAGTNIDFINADTPFYYGKTLQDCGVASALGAPSAVNSKGETDYGAEALILYDRTTFRIAVGSDFGYLPEAKNYQVDRTNRSFTIAEGDATGVARQITIESYSFSKDYYTLGGGTIDFTGERAANNIDALGNTPVVILGQGDVSLVLTGGGDGSMSLRLDDPTNGKLSISKTGSGTWYLGGKNTFTGGVKITGTTLAASVLGVTGTESLAGNPSPLGRIPTAYIADAITATYATITNQSFRSGGTVNDLLERVGEPALLTIHHYRGITVSAEAVDAIPRGLTLDVLDTGNNGQTGTTGGQQTDQDVTILSQITGGGGVEKTGNGTLLLSPQLNPNDFTGGLYITEGTVSVDSIYAIPHDAASGGVTVYYDGILQSIKGTNLEVGRLFGSGTIRNSYENAEAGSAITLYVNTTSTNSYSYFNGNIQDAPDNYNAIANDDNNPLASPDDNRYLRTDSILNIEKNGTGSLWLYSDGNSIHPYSGTIDVYEGSLVLDSAGVNGQYLAGAGLNPTRYNSSGQGASKTRRITVHDGATLNITNGWLPYASTTSAAGENIQIDELGNQYGFIVTLSGSGTPITWELMTDEGLTPVTENAGALLAIGESLEDYAQNSRQNTYASPPAYAILPRVDNIELLPGASSVVTIAVTNTLRLTNIDATSDLRIKGLDIEDFNAFGSETNSTHPSSYVYFRNGTIRLVAGSVVIAEDQLPAYPNGRGILYLSGHLTMLVHSGNDSIITGNLKDTNDNTVTNYNTDIHIISNTVDNNGIHALTYTQSDGARHVLEYTLTDGVKTYRTFDGVAVSSTYDPKIEHIVRANISISDGSSLNILSPYQPRASEIINRNTLLNLNDDGGIAVADNTSQTISYIHGGTLSWIGHLAVVNSQDPRGALPGTVIFDTPEYMPAGYENYNRFDGYIGNYAYGPALETNNTQDQYEYAQPLDAENPNPNPFRYLYDANLQIIKRGVGKFTFGGVNNYSGSTIIEQGILEVEYAFGSLGSPAAGTEAQNAENLIIYYGATLRSTGDYSARYSNSDRLFTIQKPTNALTAEKYAKVGAIIDSSKKGDDTISALTYGGIHFNSTGTIRFSENITPYENVYLTLTGNAGNNQFSPNLINSSETGTGRFFLRKSGPGEWMLKGKNTYTGDTLIENGILTIGSTTAISEGSRIVFGAPNLDDNGNLIYVNGRPTAGTAGVLKMNGFETYLTRFIIAENANTGIYNRITNAGASKLALQDPSTLHVNIAGEAVNSFGGSIGDPFSDASNANYFSFVKEGAGTLILTGAMALLGDTRIVNGTLKLSASLNSTRSEYIVVDAGSNISVSPLLDVSELSAPELPTTDQADYDFKKNYNPTGFYLKAYNDGATQYHNILVAGTPDKRVKLDGEANEYNAANPIYARDYTPDLKGTFILNGGTLQVGGVWYRTDQYDEFGDVEQRITAIADRTSSVLTIDGTLRNYWNTWLNEKGQSDPNNAVSTIQLTFSPYAENNLEGKGSTYPSDLIRATDVVFTGGTGTVLIAPEIETGSSAKGYRLEYGDGPLSSASSQPATYTVIEYTGSFSAEYTRDAANRLVIANLVFGWNDPRYDINFTHDEAQKKILMNVYPKGEISLYWVGNPLSRWGDPAKEGANFVLAKRNADGTLSVDTSVNKTSYGAGDTAIFDDRVAESALRNIFITNDNVMLGTAWFQNGSGYTYTLAEKSILPSGEYELAGALIDRFSSVPGNLIKEGLGDLRILNKNIYSGGTTLIAGRLLVKYGTTRQSITGVTLTDANDANRTYLTRVLYYNTIVDQEDPNYGKRIAAKYAEENAISTDLSDPILPAGTLLYDADGTVIVKPNTDAPVYAVAGDPTSELIGYEPLVRQKIEKSDTDISYVYNPVSTTNPLPDFSELYLTKNAEVLNRAGTVILEADPQKEEYKTLGVTGYGTAVKSASAIGIGTLTLTGGRFLIDGTDTDSAKALHFNNDLEIVGSTVLDTSRGSLSFKGTFSNGTDAALNPLATGGTLIKEGANPLTLADTGKTTERELPYYKISANKPEIFIEDPEIVSYVQPSTFNGVIRVSEGALLLETGDYSEGVRKKEVINIYGENEKDTAGNDLIKNQVTLKTFDTEGYDVSHDFDKGTRLDNAAIILAENTYLQPALKTATAADVTDWGTERLLPLASSDGEGVISIGALGSANRNYNEGVVAPQDNTDGRLILAVGSRIDAYDDTGAQLVFTGQLLDKSIFSDASAKSYLRLHKVGDGTLILSKGDNTYSGGTDVQAGVLQIGDGVNAGTFGTGITTVQNGATLRFSARDADFDTDLLATKDNRAKVQLAAGATLEKLGSSKLTITTNNDYAVTGIIYVNGFADPVRVPKADLTNQWLKDHVDHEETVGGVVYCVLDADVHLVAKSEILNNTNSATTNIAGVVASQVLDLGYGAKEYVAIDPALTLHLSADNTSDDITDTFLRENILRNVAEETTAPVAAGAAAAAGTGPDGYPATVANAAKSYYLFTSGFAPGSTIIVEDGELHVGTGKGVADSASLGSSKIINNAAVIFNRGNSAYVVSNDFEGTGDIRKEDSGTLFFTGNNNSTGVTVINGGTFVLGAVDPVTLRALDGPDASRTYAASTIQLDNSTLRLFPGEEATLTLAVDVSGTNGIVEKAGAGTAIIERSISVFGHVVINEGTLQIGNGRDASGEILGNADVTINAGGTLSFRRAEVVTLAGKITSEGRLVIAGGLAEDGVTPVPGGIRLAEDNNIGGEVFVRNNGKLYLGNGGHSGALNDGINPVTVNLDYGSKLYLDRDGEGVTSGSAVTIAGQGDFIKTGPGTATFDSIANHSGGTVVEQGRLILPTSKIPRAILTPDLYDPNHTAYLGAYGTGVLEIQNDTGSAFDLKNTVLGIKDYLNPDNRALGTVALSTGENVSSAIFNFVPQYGEDAEITGKLAQLEVCQNTTLFLGSDAKATLNAKTLLLRTSSQLTGQATIGGSLVLEKNALVASARLNQTAGDVNEGLWETGQITVNGNIHSAGRIEIKVTRQFIEDAANDTSGKHGAIHYSGTANFASGSTLDIDISLLDGDLPEKGTIVHLLVDDDPVNNPLISTTGVVDSSQNGESVSGSYIEPNTSLDGVAFTFKTDSGVALIFADSITDHPALAALDVKTGVGAYLDNLYKYSNSANPALLELRKLLTGGNINDLLKLNEALKTSASLTAMSVSAAHAATFTQRAHLEALRYDAAINNARVVHSPYFTVTGQNTRNKGADNPAFNLDNYGALVGIDHGIGSRFLVGASVGYNSGRANLHNVNDVAGKDKTETARLTAYASALFTDFLYLDAQFFYGVSDYDVRRTVRSSVTGQTSTPTTGSTDGTEFGGSLYLGSVIAFTKDSHFHLTPFIGFQYVRSNVDGFSEIGPATTALRVDKFQQDSLRARIGTGANFLHQFGNTVYSRFSLEAAFTSELLDNEVDLSAQLACDTSKFRFSTSAPSTAKHSAQFGPAVELYIGEHISLNVSYTYESDFSSHTIHHASAGFRLRF